MRWIVLLAAALLFGTIDPAKAVLITSVEHENSLQFGRFGETPETHHLALGPGSSSENQVIVGTRGEKYGNLWHRYESRPGLVELEGGFEFGVPLDFQDPLSAMLNCGFRIEITVDGEPLLAHLFYDGIEPFAHGADIIESDLPSEWTHRGGDLWAIPVGAYIIESHAMGQINGTDDGGDTFGESFRFSLIEVPPQSSVQTPEPAAAIVWLGLGGAMLVAARSRGRLKCSRRASAVLPCRP